MPGRDGAGRGSERALSTCTTCGCEVRPVWPTCRSCGALLIQPPAPAPREPVTATATSETPSQEQQFFAPAVLGPVGLQRPPVAPSKTARPGRSRAIAGVVAFLAAAVVSAWFALKPASGHEHPAPVALAPKAATNAIPTSLSDVVRMQAESARRNAVQAVALARSGDPAALAAAQPSFTWVRGTTASSGPKQVSVQPDASGAGSVTVAVAATNHDVCAFGRWSPGGAPQYVTMAHEPACRAADAPGAGWSAEAGGAFSDLPDDNG